MNKDVIYVEPENDITDIITKIENSPEKIVALVPPKKAGVFRSAVNIKLIARAGVSAEKTVVLVTVDPSIIKLAAVAKIPVTKDLRTPPSIPEVEEDENDAMSEEIIEGDAEGDEEPLEETENPEDQKQEEDAEAKEEDEEDSKKGKKKKKKDSGKGFKGWVKAHKVPVIICSIAGVAAIAFCVWAFVFAPSVKVAVEMQTEMKSFAENVSFTTNAQEEDAKNGVFYLQEKKIEQSQEIKFDATGKVNQGEKARGSITVSKTFDLDGGPTVAIPSGTTFSAQGLNYVAEQGASISYGGKASELRSCENANPQDEGACTRSVTITVVAAEAGSKYNIGETNHWSASVDISGASSSAMSGGTDKEVTVVEQIDVERAKNQLQGDDEGAEKQKLLAEIGDKMLPIDPSFSIETTNAEASPGVGQEVSAGTTPVLKATTTAKIYAIDKSKLEEFVSEKADLPDDQKIYEFNDPFVESFAQGGAGFVGRLKTNYNAGPKVSNTEIVDMIKGKGLGEAQNELKNINGVVNVTINKSYPWVMKVPGNPNKVSVDINVRDNEK